jgi:hypothetical protein
VTAWIILAMYNEHSYDRIRMGLDPPIFRIDTQIIAAAVNCLFIWNALCGDALLVSRMSQSFFLTHTDLWEAISHMGSLETEVLSPTPPDSYVFVLYHSHVNLRRYWIFAHCDTAS